MFLILDIFLTIFHLGWMFFNLTGWYWPKTRKLHLIAISLTLASWVILGIWFGMGYCPLTDLHWEIKMSRGESELPDSFVKYVADAVTGADINSLFLDILTSVALVATIAISIYTNYFRERRNQYRSM